MPAPLPTTLPHGHSARRVQWDHLPPVVRREVERRIGATVVDADSQDAGFTPGFASLLTDQTGARHFVKAASTKAQRAFAQAYRDEAATLAALPAGVPAPPLLWTADVADWFVLSTAYVDARAPRRPWCDTDLARCSAMLVDTAAALTPPPAPGRAGWVTAAVELGAWPECWSRLTDLYTDLHHADEAAALAARYAEVVGGDTLVHTDVRDDNLLLTDGGVLLCDWNWPCVGAAWLDSLLLLVGPRGDGLDVESFLATHPLLGGVPTDHVDVVLALVTGYFLHSASQPSPPTSPHLRDAQLWQGEVCWEWLSERRGWS